MLIHDRKAFLIGLVMAITFWLVFIFLLTPSFNGKNAFEASDGLFNSIAKGSTYYIPGLRAKAESYRGTSLSASLRLDAKAPEARSLLAVHGVEVTDSGSDLEVRADLGSLLLGAIEDSDMMFHNRGGMISEKYGIPEKQALFTWWTVLNALNRSLNNQSRFSEAALVAEVTERGVEVAYKFYGIEPEKASSDAGILSFSLIFYVLYTLLWGYAIFYLAHGLGFQMKAGAKKEV